MSAPQDVVTVGKMLTTAGQPTSQIEIELPYRDSLRYRAVYPLLLGYYRLMGLFPGVGRFLLWQNPRERNVLRFPATATALLAIYTYPGIFGTLRETRGNLWSTLWGAVHQNSQNARDVRHRTLIGADLLNAGVLEGASNLVDLAAGSALAIWLMLKEHPEFSGRIVLVDQDIHSVVNTYEAALKAGLYGKIKIEPALILDQPKIIERTRQRIEKALSVLKKNFGLDLTADELVNPVAVSPGSLFTRLKDGKVYPIIGNARDFARFLNKGAFFDLAITLGFLDYLTPSEITDNLVQVREVINPTGGKLIAAHMDNHPEFRWVLNVPWYGATKARWVLKPKSAQEFVSIVETSGYFVKRVLRTAGGVYNLILATR